MSRQRLGENEPTNKSFKYDMHLGLRFLDDFQFRRFNIKGKDAIFPRSITLFSTI